MAETKYGKYFVTEPIEQGPMLHICGDEACYGKQFPDFPAEIQLLCARPGVMIPKPHSHDVRFPYKPDEIIKLRQGITEGIIKPLKS